MYKVFIYFIIFCGLFINCHPSQQIAQSETLSQKAVRLAMENIITDGHIDLPYRLRVKNFRLEKEFLGIPIETSEGDFDYVRSKAGGLDAPFMSIYIPSRYQKEGGAYEIADSLINMVQGIILAHPDKFAHGNSPQTIEKHHKEGKVSLPMGMENGAPIGEDLNNIDYFFKRGVRYITLTHSKDNQICDSSYDTTGTWQGLSPFGRKVIPKMNQTGMMIDVSHISDNTFYQVMELTEVPVIASHSSCRKFTPGFERNMNDEMLKALKQNGGVIQINFGSTFLSKEIQDHRKTYRDQLNKLLKEKKLKRSDEAAKPIIQAYQKDNENLWADVSLVADHIDHVVKVAGIDHVGFGSDYDGVGDSLPTGLKDVSDYPNLIKELLKRGYTDDDIAKICYKNVWRVWSKVLSFADNN